LGSEKSACLTSKSVQQVGEPEEKCGGVGVFEKNQREDEEHIVEDLGKEKKWKRGTETPRS